MRSEDRFVVAGTSRDVVEQALLTRGATPAADWSSYRLAEVVLDGEPTALAATVVGAPPEHVDQAATDAVMAPAVALMKKRTRQLIQGRIVTGVASVALSIVSLAIGPAHSHARSGPPLREFDSAAVSAQLAFRYGITGAQCNDRHPLRYDHLGQQFTCTAGAATYRLTVTDLDPFEFTLVEAT